MSELSKITSMISAARRRLFVRRFVRAIWYIVAATLGIAAILVVVQAVSAKCLGAAWGLLALPIIIELIWAAVSAHRLDDLEIAKAIDIANAFNERLSSSLAFARDNKQTPWMRAHIDDTNKRLENAETRDQFVKNTFPVERPVDAKYALIAAICLGLALAVPPVLRALLSSDEPIATTQPDQPTPDDTPAFESNIDDATRELREEQTQQLLEAIKDSEDEELKKAAEELNKILEEDKNGELSADEFQKRLEELQKKLAETDPAPKEEQQALDQTLKQALDELTQMQEDPDTKDLSQALQNSDYDKAANILKDLLNSTDPKDAKKLEKLAKMFGDLAKKLDMTDPALQEALKKNQDLMDQLEQKFKKDGKLTDEEKKAFSDAKKRLDEAQQQRDEQAQADPSQRSTNEMQKAFDQTAKDLQKRAEQAKKPGEADPKQGQEQQQAQEGQQGQEQQGEGQQQGQEQQQAQEGQQGQGQQGAEQQLGQEAKNRADQQSRDALKDLADKMKKDAQNNNAGSDAQSQADKQERAQNMEDFLDRAKGNEGTKSQKQDAQKQDQQGQQGQQDQQGDQDQNQAGQQAQQQGENSQNQQGSEPSQQGQPNQQGGEESKMGAQQSGQQQPGNEQGNQEGQNSQGLSQGLSEQGGHDESEGASTHMDVNAVDQQLKGQVGNAPTTSEIIHTSGQSGFATEAYREVYQSYEHAAEEVLENDSVPQGYRHYVEKYFDMIRPQ